LTEPPTADSATPPPPGWPPERPRAPFGRRFLALFLPGLLGIAALPFALLPLLRQAFESQPPPGGIGFTLFVLLTLINPVILLATGVAVGLAFAHRVGFRSRIDDRVSFGTPLGPGLRADSGVALAVGVVVGIVVLAGDMALRPLLDGAAADIARAMPSHAALLAGLLYGGITEELVTRWGLLSLVAWALWRVLQRNDQPPLRWIVWAAIAVSAAAFGAAHLPLTGAVTDLTVPVVLRALLLNGLGALAFGWLYWRRSLEAAMLAHGASHIVLFAGALLLGAPPP
jgi:membrane protease YdiL (CAAX protease family)